MKSSDSRIFIAVSCFVLFLGVTGLIHATLAGPGQPVIKPPDDPAGLSRGDGRHMDKVLIRVPKPYGPLVEAIRARGGAVTHQYRNFDGLAAQIPHRSLREILAIAGPGAVSKDLLMRVPDVRDRGRERAGELTRPGDPVHAVAEPQIAYSSARELTVAEVSTLAAVHPEAYLFNNALLNVGGMHAQGHYGQGVIVAVIDSGIRPGFFHLESDGSVIGGEDFVGDGLGFSNFANNGHGTFVAGMISANAFFGFDPNSVFFKAVEAYAPEAIYVDIDGTPLVPMIGSAPGAPIFAMRVFGPSGGGPTSVVLAAVDRAIELRRMYDAGDPDGVNIRVVNMSLSGPTLFAGRDLFDTSVDAMVENDIVVTNSAGNAGPSSLTVGSPGSSMGTITVGAASLAANERIVRALQFVPYGYPLEIGGQFRPFDGMETATFSSRGPNADGRIDPDVTASGDWNYGMGLSDSTGNVSFAGGTSFSTPTVAGVAALLRQSFPQATALQVRNAIIASANPALLDDGSTVIDQGGGFVDAGAAYDLLATGKVKDRLPKPRPFRHKVKSNIKKNAHLRTEKNVVMEHVGPLRPGERGEIIYEVPSDTSLVTVGLANITPVLPPAEQNLLFGDDILLTIHSPKTSRQPGTGDYLVDRFVDSDRTFNIPEPEEGLMRITLSGDWTNAGAIAADVMVSSERERLKGRTFEGKIEEFEQIDLPLDIPPGVAEARFRLVWEGDWSRYPVSDLDLILTTPGGLFFYDGATLNEPEVVVVTNPPPGPWILTVFGYEIHTKQEKYKLRVTFDGDLVP